MNIVKLVKTIFQKSDPIWPYRYEAQRQRYERRLNYHLAGNQAQLAHVNRDAAKLLAVKSTRPTREMPGFIHIEIPELFRWVAAQNSGVMELLHRAVCQAAVSQLSLILA